MNGFIFNSNNQPTNYVELEFSFLFLNEPGFHHEHDSVLTLYEVKDNYLL